jgi:catechol 2,3-dioxygenase-like lactoylglutathione lyase family enzyme
MGSGMTRVLRRVFPVLLVLVALPLRAQVAPAYAGIDHVEFFVADLDRSLDFYTRVFGADLWKNKQTERRYLRLGQSYLALEARELALGAPHVDHVCFGIEDFDIDNAHGWLKAQTIPWQDYPSGRDLRVDDFNGIRTQLAQSGGWEQITANTAQQETRQAAGKPIFEAYAIDEVFLSVSNLEVDSLFYSRLLDQTGDLQQGSLWFRVGSSRLRLTQTPVGQKSGVSWFAVHVAFTDMEEAADAVFAAGGIIENILPNGFSFWDPDGIRIVVRSGDLY